MLHFKPRKIFLHFWPFLSLFFLVLFFSLFFPRSLTFLSRPLAWLGSEISQWPIFPSAECSQERAQLAALAFDRTAFENLQIENKELRQQLNFFERQSFSRVTANIINRSASVTDETFIIDRGVDDGIKEGAAVIVSEGHMIGRVLKTSAKISTVRSILSPSSKVTTSILNISRAIGLAEGAGGALLNLNFIPQDQAIFINDLIVTSGLEQGIPSSLIMGIVTGITTDQAAPFQKATVEPLVDLRLSRTVSVVILPSDL